MNHQTTYRTWNRCMYRVPSLCPPNAVMCKIWTFSQCCVSWLLAGLVFLKSEISKIMFIIARMHGLWEQEMSDLGGRDMKGPSWIPCGPYNGPMLRPFTSLSQMWATQCETEVASSCTFVRFIRHRWFQEFASYPRPMVCSYLRLVLTVRWQAGEGFCFVLVVL